MNTFLFNKHNKQESLFQELVQYIPYGAILLLNNDDKLFVQGANRESFALLGIDGAELKKRHNRFRKIFPDLWNNRELKIKIAKTSRDFKKRELFLKLNTNKDNFKYIQIVISRISAQFVLLTLQNRLDTYYDSRIIEITNSQINLIGDLTGMLTKDVSVSELLKLSCDRLKEIYNLSFSDAWIRDQSNLLDTTSPVYSNIESHLLSTLEKAAGMTYKSICTPVEKGSIWEELYINRQSVIADKESLAEIIANFVSRDQIALRKLAPVVAGLLNVKFVMMVPMIVNNKTIGHIGFDSNTQMNSHDVESLKLVVDKVASIIDIKRSYEKQEEIEVMLRQSQKLDAVGHLAGGIAHDFNNLLTGIMGNTQMAQMECERNPFTSELLGEVYATSKKAAKLVKQLLTYSRNQIIYPKPVKIQEMIDEVSSLIVFTLGDNIKFDCKISNRDLWVNADSSQLEHALLNLAVNARDAMPDGGYFTISVEADSIDDNLCRKLKISPGEYICITISDTGTGMSKTTIANIFEPFFTTKDVGKGTGLGLSMVYGIVRQHNGGIFVESGLKEGTSFYLYLPQIEPESDSKTKNTISSVPPVGMETILYVEDDSIVRRTTNRMLSRMGYKVLIASSGKEAFKVASEYKGKIHLLLSDVVMPGICGFEVAEKLVATDKYLKVQFVSGYSEDALPVRPVSVKGNIVSKPYSSGELAKAIRTALNS